MTSVTETSRRRTAPALGTFERYLTLWVGLCILAGIVIGRLVPAPFQALGRIKDLGLGVLLVEQNAIQSLAIGSRGYLLANGRIVGEGAAGDLQSDPAVRRAYLGGGPATGETPAAKPPSTSSPS